MRPGVRRGFGRIAGYFDGESDGTLAGQRSSFHDLFRVENGKIAEHWDTIEPVPAKQEWKNLNGRFSTLGLRYFAWHVACRGPG